MFSLLVSVFHPDVSTDEPCTITIRCSMYSMPDMTITKRLCHYADEAAALLLPDASARALAGREIVLRVFISTSSVSAHRLRSSVLNDSAPSL